MTGVVRVATGPAAVLVPGVLAAATKGAEFVWSTPVKNTRNSRWFVCELQPATRINKVNAAATRRDHVIGGLTGVS